MQVLDFLTNTTVVFFFANTLYVISYMVTSMLWLRVLAVIAALSTLPYFYLQAEPLWSAIFWQACFLAVNLVNLLILLNAMRARKFNDNEQQAYDLKFSNLEPHEARTIFRYAEHLTLKAGQKLLTEGEANRNLYLLLQGSCRVEKGGTHVAELGPGSFAGELSFLSDETVSADVFANGDLCLMVWDKNRLQSLFRRQGLFEAYFYSLCSLDVADKLRFMTQAQAAKVTAS
jgi:CRP-like cAMP-binding protein